MINSWDKTAQKAFQLSGKSGQRVQTVYVENVQYAPVLVCRKKPITSNQMEFLFQYFRMYKNGFKTLLYFLQLFSEETRTYFCLFSCIRIQDVVICIISELIRTQYWWYVGTSSDLTSDNWNAVYEIFNLCLVLFSIQGYLALTLQVICLFLTSYTYSRFNKVSLTL